MWHSHRQGQILTYRKCSIQCNDLVVSAIETLHRLLPKIVLDTMKESIECYMKYCGEASNVNNEEDTAELLW